MYIVLRKYIHTLTFNVNMYKSFTYSKVYLHISFPLKSTMHIQIQCMWSLFTTKWIYSKCSQNFLNRSPPIYIHSFNPPGGTGLVSSVGGAVSEPLERPTGPVMSSITLWTRRFNNVYTILWYSYVSNLIPINRYDNNVQINLIQFNSIHIVLPWRKHSIHVVLPWREHSIHYIHFIKCLFVVL